MRPCPNKAVQLTRATAGQLKSNKKHNVSCLWVLLKVALRKPGRPSTIQYLSGPEPSTPLKSLLTRPLLDGARERLIRRESFSLGGLFTFWLILGELWLFSKKHPEKSRALERERRMKMGKP